MSVPVSVYVQMLMSVPVSVCRVSHLNPELTDSLSKPASLP
ncbi:hypothetical protein T4D_10571 [Trichinella pseudospiralis]|uniref:Uncharacterized protein n=1 Tax=Trichinella pseudospiralis TaxID=6337 RepID=A0A0V1DL86_TRIPS|nr:hypothetical protein T4D_10571 [Trichinella pseudospiralis]